MAKSNKSRELSNAKAVLEACGDIHEQRTDGYQNMLTKYGTKHDSSTAFSFVPEELTDDYTLGINYQFNGLFAKIIDLPAGEAVSKGFKLNINNADVEKEIMKKCAQLDLEENLETAIKWSRLYGGAIAVMLIYDGRGLDEPLNYKTIRGIDEIKVYEAAVVNPLFSSSYYSGEPEFYQVNALEGTFTVHASRCLPFRNGKLPQQVVDSKRRVFGFAEYDRIKTALRETVTSHGYAPRMLERAIQSIIKIKDLANLLATSQGEDTVVRRLQLIDMARSMFNSMAIDADGEDFDFKSAPYSGVKEILDSTCNMLSAVTNIPQTLLFGSSPQGMDSTGESDLENWYNYVGQIQKRMVKSPLETLIGIIVQTLVRTGKIEDYPEWELEFEPLWSMSEAEQAQVDLTRAQAKLAKAQTAQLYVDMQAIDATEIRTGLAKSEEYDVETLLDDVPNDELFASMIDESSDEAPPVPPAMPQGGTETEETGNNIFEQGDFSEFAKDSEIDAPTAAAVLVVNSEGKVLCGVRSDNNLVCGPGGHIEEGEQPIVAAIRESQEEFGITPTSLIPLATLGENNALHHKTDIFLCTSFSGTPKCDGKEMKLASFITLEELLENRDKMFKPFLDSLEVLENYRKKMIDTVSTSAIMKSSDSQADGGPGSGNFGHEGRPGKRGGSAPEGEGSSSEGKSESKEEKKSESKKSEGSKKPPESRPVASVKKTPAPEFKAKFDEAKATQAPEDAWRVDDTYTVADYEHANCFTTEGGSCVAVKPDGDIVSVCKNMSSTDRGSDLLKRAVEQGGDRLDAFGEGLYKFYTKNGFEPVSWTSFDKTYAPHDWVEGRDQEEEVVFYKYTGKKTTMTYLEFLSSTPESPEYGDAKKARDSGMEDKR